MTAQNSRDKWQKKGGGMKRRQSRVRVPEEGRGARLLSCCPLQTGLQAAQTGGYLLQAVAVEDPDPGAVDFNQLVGGQAPQDPG